MALFPPETRVSRMIRRLYQYGAFVVVRVAHRHDITVTGPEHGARRFERVASDVISGRRRMWEARVA